MSKQTPEEIARQLNIGFRSCCRSRCAACEQKMVAVIRARDAEAERELAILRAQYSRLEAQAESLVTMVERFAEHKAELVEALRMMLKSAVPHPVEHPTMTAAWKIGEAALAKHAVERPQELDAKSSGGVASA